MCQAVYWICSEKIKGESEQTALEHFYTPLLYNGHRDDMDVN